MVFQAFSTWDSMTMRERERERVVDPFIFLGFLPFQRGFLGGFPGFFHLGLDDNEREREREREREKERLYFFG